MNKYRNKITAGVIIAILLTFAFWYGGDSPNLHGWTPQPKDATVVQNDEPVNPEIEEAKKATNDIPLKEETAPATEEAKQQKQNETPMIPAKKSVMAESTQSSNGETEAKTTNEACSEEQGMVIDEAAKKDQHITDHGPEENPIPIEPENAVITDKELTCILSVRCDTILNNIGWLDSDKVDIVPKDGVIFAEKTVTFYEGESVFNVLVREMKRNKIHFEFENIPIYNSVYIEGIANLYEFDCGELSGWMYKVNGWFPNYGCSRYQLKSGDRVECVYTCDLGNDVGGHYSARNGK